MAVLPSYGGVGYCVSPLEWDYSTCTVLYFDFLLWKEVEWMMQHDDLVYQFHFITTVSYFFPLLPDIMWILYMSCLYLLTLMFFLQHLTVNWCSVLLFWPGVMFSLLTVWCVPCPVPPSPCPDVEYFWRLPWPDLDWPDPRLLLTQGSLLDTDFSHPVFVFRCTYVSV